MKLDHVVPVLPFGCGKLLADLGVHAKSVWLEFEQPVSESDCAGLGAVCPGLQRSGETVLVGEMDGPMVVAILSAAASRKLRLRNLRVDGNELEKLMDPSR